MVDNNICIYSVLLLSSLFNCWSDCAELSSSCDPKLFSPTLPHGQIGWVPQPVGHRPGLIRRRVLAVLCWPLPQLPRVTVNANAVALHSHAAQRHRVEFEQLLSIAEHPEAVAEPYKYLHSCWLYISNLKSVSLWPIPVLPIDEIYARSYYRYFSKPKNRHAPAQPEEDRLPSPDLKSFNTSTTSTNRGRKRRPPG